MAAVFKPMNFVPKGPPAVPAWWLNSLDVLAFDVLNGAQTLEQLQAAIGLGGGPVSLNSPFSVTAPNGNISLQLHADGTGFVGLGNQPFPPPSGPGGGWSWTSDGTMYYNNSGLPNATAVGYDSSYMARSLDIFSNANPAGSTVMIHGGANTKPNIWIEQVGSGSSDNAAAGCCNGLLVIAGTNVNDNVFQVVPNAQASAAANNPGAYFSVRGDGSGWVGPSEANSLRWDVNGHFSVAGTATLPGGSTGGVSALSQLSDVSVSGQHDGQVLTWASSINRWEPGAVMNFQTGTLGALFSPPLKVRTAVVNPPDPAHDYCFDIDDNGVVYIGPPAVAEAACVIWGAGNYTNLWVEMGPSNIVGAGWCAIFQGGGPGDPYHPEWGATLPGCSNGIKIQAGTNSQDYAVWVEAMPLSITNEVAVHGPTFMQIAGDGSGYLGPNASQDGFNWTNQANYFFASLQSSVNHVIESDCHPGQTGIVVKTNAGTATTPPAIDVAHDLFRVHAPAPTLPAGSAVLEVGVPSSSIPNVSQWVASFSNQASATGNSGGIWIAAGTNSQDMAITVEPAQSNMGPMFFIAGDGSGGIGKGGNVGMPVSSKMVWDSNIHFSFQGGAQFPLDILTNVTITSPTNGQALVYDGPIGRWVNGPLLAGTSISQIGDVHISGTVIGQVLMWNGVDWVNQSLPPGVTSITAGTGLTGGVIQSVGTIALAPTSVVPGTYTNSTITVNAEGQVTSASNGVQSLTQLSQLTDVAISGPSTHQVLTWNGTEWVNEDPWEWTSAGPLYGPILIQPGAQSQGPTLTVDGAVNYNAFMVSGALNTTPGHWLATFTGPVAPPGMTNGVMVGAGSSASDINFLLQNSAETQKFFEVFGDGSGAIGPAPNQLVWNAQGQFTLTGTATLPGGGGGGALVPPVVINGTADTVPLTVNAATTYATNSWCVEFLNSTATGTGTGQGVHIRAADNSARASLLIESANASYGQTFRVDGIGGGFWGRQAAGQIIVDGGAGTIGFQSGTPTPAPFGALFRPNGTGWIGPNTTLGLNWNNVGAFTLSPTTTANTALTIGSTTALAPNSSLGLLMAGTNIMIQGNNIASVQSGGNLTFQSAANGGYGTQAWTFSQNPYWGNSFRLYTGGNIMLDLDSQAAYFNIGQAWGPGSPPLAINFFGSSVNVGSTAYPNPVPLNVNGYVQASSYRGRTGTATYSWDGMSTATFTCDLNTGSTFTMDLGQADNDASAMDPPLTNYNVNIQLTNSQNYYNLFPVKVTVSPGWMSPQGASLMSFGTDWASITWGPPGYASFNAIYSGQPDMYSITFDPVSGVTGTWLTSGAGPGTVVSSITGGSGIAASPNPITSTGTIAVDTTVARTTLANTFSNLNTFSNAVTFNGGGVFNSQLSIPAGGSLTVAGGVSITTNWVNLGSATTVTALSWGTSAGTFTIGPPGTVAPGPQQLRISSPGGGGTGYMLIDNSVTPAVFRFGQTGYPNNITVYGGVTATAASTFAGLTSSAAITVTAGGCNITGGGAFSGSYSCSGGNWSYANVLQANAGLTAGAAGTNTGITVNGQAGITIAAGATATGFTNNSPLGITNPNGIVGITNGADPTAGRIGEYMTASGTLASLTSGSWQNVGVINLTPGDWDITGTIFYNSSTNSGTGVAMGLSLSPASLAATTDYTSTPWSAWSANFAVTSPLMRQNISAATPVYLATYLTFGSGTVSANWKIQARRVR